MSDLINRKSVLDKLKDFSDMYTLDEEARIVLETIVRIVTEQPTAYDISKVVAELGEEKTMAYDKWDGGSSYKAYSQAIDIVKRGGVE